MPITYLNSVLDAAAEKMLKAKPPEPQKSTRKQALERIKKPVTVMLDRGYTYAQIAKFLAENGVQIPASALASHMKNNKKIVAAKLATEAAPVVVTAPVSAPVPALASKGLPMPPPKLRHAREGT